MEELGKYSFIILLTIGHLLLKLLKLKNNLNQIKHACTLEMSSSWNFPARASPSYEGSEPSRAEPSWGTSIFMINYYIEAAE